MFWSSSASCAARPQQHPLGCQAAAGAGGAGGAGRGQRWGPRLPGRLSRAKHPLVTASCWLGAQRAAVCQADVIRAAHCAMAEIQAPSDPMLGVQGDGSDDEGDVCRICRMPGEERNSLFYPCKCSGSIKFVHQQCLTDWLAHSGNTHCEVGAGRLHASHRRPCRQRWECGPHLSFLAHHAPAGVQAPVCLHAGVRQGCARHAALARAGRWRVPPGRSGDTGGPQGELRQSPTPAHASNRAAPCPLASAQAQ